MITLLAEATRADELERTVYESCLPKVPLSVCLGLLCAIILDTGVQLFWKYAVLQVNADFGTFDSLWRTLTQPAFLAVAVLFLLQLFNWLKVLEKADVSYAQPITSLSYVSVCAFSAMFLHEKIAFTQLIGVALILAGVWFISQTDHNTQAEGESH